MSNSRVALGWLFLSGLLSSLEVVLNEVPVDLLGFVAVYVCLNVCVVVAMATAATASTTTPARAPMSSLRKTLSLLRGTGTRRLASPGAGGGASRSHLRETNPGRQPKLRHAVASFASPRPSPHPRSRDAARCGVARRALPARPHSRPAAPP